MPTLREILDHPETFLTEENNFGFFDWFCSGKALERRGRSLLAKVRKISRSIKIDLDTMTLTFKNCMPVAGSLFDEFHIYQIGDDSLSYNVIPQSGFKIAKGRSEVWCFENKFQGASFIGEHYRDVVTWFMEENKRFDALNDEDIPLSLSVDPWSTNAKRLLINRLKEETPWKRS